MSYTNKHTFFSFLSGECSCVVLKEVLIVGNESFFGAKDTLGGAPLSGIALPLSVIACLRSLGSFLICLAISFGSSLSFPGKWFEPSLRSFPLELILCVFVTSGRNWTGLRIWVTGALLKSFEFKHFKFWNSLSKWRIPGLASSCLCTPLHHTFPVTEFTGIFSIEHIWLLSAKRLDDLSCADRPRSLMLFEWSLTVLLVAFIKVLILLFGGGNIKFFHRDLHFFIKNQ